MSDVRTRLWDAETAGRWIVAAISGWGFTQYAADERTRLAVERQLITVVRHWSPRTALHRL